MAWLKVSLSPLSTGGASTGDLARLVAGALAFLATERLARAFFATDFLILGFFIACRSTLAGRATQICSRLLPRVQQRGARAAYDGKQRADASTVRE